MFENKLISHKDLIKTFISTIQCNHKIRKSNNLTAVSTIVWLKI